MAETFDTLWSYCTSNNRAIPRDWNKFWQMLSNKKQKTGGGWEPPLPLILAAWYETSPLEKHLRFREHIQWVEKQNQLDEIGKYLKSLPENEWFHFGELPT
jgi:hypothetical protein